MEIEKVKERILEARPGFTRQYGPSRTDHQPGIPFFPQEATRDLVLILFLVAIMFFLSAVVTPFLGPARDPFSIGEVIVPDWYLLYSYGLLKVADILPVFTIAAGTPLEMQFNPRWWGDLLTLLPIIYLVLIPFVDRGRESRPAKAPVRSAVGLGFIFTWTFFASLYSIREIIGATWRAPDGKTALVPDDTMKWFFVIPAILVGLSSYIGLRRLGYRPMRKWLVPTTVGAFLIVALHSLLILFVPGWLGDPLKPYWLPLAGFLLILTAASAAAAIAVVALPESKAVRAVHWTGIFGFVAFVAFYEYMQRTDFNGMWWILSVLLPNMNTLIFLPVFGVMTAWFGLRRPYSTYEYLLNECYQCGKCHIVCPVTKVEDDALGGLNLVYNTYKKEHDGVPLWTCLACDACSAVCPLDIRYSDYILEERAKSQGRLAADGGERARQ